MLRRLPLNFFRLRCIFSRYVSLFPLLLFPFFFVIYYKFLIFPFFFPLLWLSLFSSFWNFSIYLLLLCFSWVSMVSSSEVRIACPSVSFLFARLGGSLGVFPNLEDFVFEGNSLKLHWLSCVLCFVNLLIGLRVW